MASVVGNTSLLNLHEVMRLKVDIQKHDDWRVLVLFRKGLKEAHINAINNLAKKNEWKDVAFAPLDDNRVALVCLPATGAKIFQWDAKQNKVKHPDDFIKDFLCKANEALHGDNLQLYVEGLTRDEEELKKAMLEEALEFRRDREDKDDDKIDKTWEDDDA